MAYLLRTAFLWLWVIDLGIALGAGLYESRIVVPQWLTASPDAALAWRADAARQANTGLGFWLYATTIPLTVLTVANAWAAWRTRGAARKWWLLAAVLVIAERAMTFAYFIPTMGALMRDSGLADASALAIAMQWVELNRVRHGLIAAAWLFALRTLWLVARGEDRRYAF